LNEFKTYTANVAEICENGDAILELPPELCEDMGWKEGTVLNIELENGQIIISEVNNDDRNKSLDKPS
jgi:antitoxin component of MazEF toxin-antitoxin module